MSERPVVQLIKDAIARTEAARKAEMTAQHADYSFAAGMIYMAWKAGAISKEEDLQFTRELGSAYAPHLQPERTINKGTVLR